jgi:hypothetical protein
MGFALVIEFIEQLKLRTAEDYSAFTNLPTLQFIIIHTKFSQFILHRRCLVMDPNSVLFCSCYWLVTISDLTHGSKCVFTFSAAVHLLDIPSLTLAVNCLSGLLIQPWY